MGTPFGIEEEFFLLDPTTFLPRAVPSEMAEELLGTKVAGSSTQRELLACQLESATAICSTGKEGLEALRGYRKALKAKSADYDLVPLASGTAPMLPAEMDMAPVPRYHRIDEFVPAITREHYINGLHVHVQIDDPQSGLDAMNTLRSWLPLFAALGANSPLWNGEETGFASWRTVHYRRWSITGIPPVFTDLREYRHYLDTLIAADAILDPANVCWGTRLSEHYPTIEVRVADVQRRPEESVMLALLIRAIVDTVVRGGAQASPTPMGLLELSLWQAAKTGIDGRYFDAARGVNIEMDAALEHLLEYAGPALRESGDEEFVLEQLRRMRGEGNGAQRQRASWARGGLRQLVQDAAQEFAGERSSG